ncbi:hypothetical protein Hanom_Chr08g00728171 [Helianthus anomalus]
MLVDESDKEDEAVTEGDAKGDQVHLSPEFAKLLKALNVKLAASENEVISNLEKEKQKKRKRSGKNDDDLYIPSPDHVQDTPTPPSSGGRKKASARKRVVTPKAAKRLRVLLKNKPIQELNKPPTPPPEPQQQPSLIQSPPHQSPPKQPTPPHQPSPPHLSPPHQPSPQSSPHIHIATPPHEQPIVTSQQIFQTPPSTQPLVQTTPGSFGFKDFPHIRVNIPLDDIGDFNFANDEQVMKLEKKVDEVLDENKKLLGREKKLEKCVKTVEALNSSLLKKSWKRKRLRETKRISISS